MSALNTTTISLTRQPLPTRSGLRTYIVATVATGIGALAIAAAMTLSIVLASPASSFGAAPAPEPMPQPSVIAGLDR